MVPCVKDNNPLARKRSFHWISMKSRHVRAARETSKFQNWSHLNNCRRYMTEILPIWRKTLSNQSIFINWSCKFTINSVNIHYFGQITMNNHISHINKNVVLWTPLFCVSLLRYPIHIVPCFFYCTSKIR